MTGRRGWAWGLAATVGLVTVGVSPAVWRIGAWALGELERWVSSLGVAGPAVFVGVYAAAVCLLVPSSPLTALGAVVFGPGPGFVYVSLGSLLGAAGAFGLARAGGRRAVERLLGGRLKRWDEALTHGGGAAVFLARLGCVPFTPVSFGFGLTGVPFRTYLWGTALGMTPGNLAFTYLFGATAEDLRGGAISPFTVVMILALSAAAGAGLVLARRRLRAARARAA